MIESNQLNAQLIASTTVIPARTPFASAPLYIGALRWGTLQIIAAAAKNPSGFIVKLQGSNIIWQGNLVGDYTAAVKAILDYGGLNPTNLGWTDLDFTADAPGGAASLFLPVSAPAQIPAFDVNWLRAVVTPKGPGTVALDIWAKFKSGV